MPKRFEKNTLVCRKNRGDIDLIAVNGDFGDALRKFSKESDRVRDDFKRKCHFHSKNEQRRSRENLAKKRNAKRNEKYNAGHKY